MADERPTGIYLSKFLLVNWSLHQVRLYSPVSSDGTIFAGSNGSGKTTALDALLVVLLGTTNRSIFNQSSAAKGEEARTLKNYLIGKKEGYNVAGVREGKDFSTHIVCEFFDSMRRIPITVGFVVDYRATRADGSLVPCRYIYEGGLPESNFVLDGEAVSVHGAKVLLSQLEQEGAIGKLRFFDTVHEYQEAFLRVMGITDAGYFNALRNLVSMKMDMRIEDFIFKYLCDSNGVASADDMNTVLDSWQTCAEELEQAKVRKSEIDEECSLFDSWAAAKHSLTVSERALSLRSVEDVQGKIRAAERDANRYRSDLDLSSARIADVETRIAAASEECGELEKAIGGNDWVRQTAEISGKIAQLVEKSDDAQQQFDTEFRRLVKAQDVLSQLSAAPSGVEEIDAGITALLGVLGEADALGAGVFGPESSAPERIVGLSDDLIRKLDDAIAEERVARAMAIKGGGEASELIRQLESGKRPSRNGPDDLVAFIERDAGCRVACVCDAIDIDPEEEAWRGAVEGVLGPRRFDLLVAPRDFERAWRSYRRFNHAKRSRLVNTPGIIKHMRGRDVSDTSLAAKVVSEDGPFHEAASAFVRWTLGRVECCDDLVSFMREHPASSAVTVTGERYEAFCAFTIRHDILSDAAIGRKANEERRRHLLADARERMRAADEKKASADNRVASLNAIRSACLGSDSAFGQTLEAARESFNMADQCSLKIAALTQAMESIEGKDGEVSDLLSEVERIKGVQLDLKKDRDALNQKIGSIAAKLEGAESRIRGLNESLAEVEANAVEELGDPDAERMARDRASKKTVAEISAEIGAAKTDEGRTWFALTEYRRQHLRLVGSEGAEATSADNGAWEREARRIESNLIPDLDKQFAEIEEEAKRGFTSSIVSKIRNGIEEIRTSVREVNRLLARVPFGDIHYRFVCEPNKDFERFYQMVTDEEFENTYGGLWDSAFYAKHGHTVDEFFSTIRDSRVGASKEIREEATLQKKALLDFRSYLVFDMKEIHDDGSELSLKKGLAGNSNGEQRLPFYITLVASLAKKCRTAARGQESDTLRIVLLDESFSGIDDENTERMLGVIRDLGLQPIYATPNLDSAYRFGSYTGSGFLHSRDGLRFEVTSWYEDDPLYQEAS